MKLSSVAPSWAIFVVATSLVAPPAAAAAQESGYTPPQRPLRVEPAAVSSDKSVGYDYDIVYVRAPRVAKGRDGKDVSAEVWPDAGDPGGLRAPTDLMVLHPDGSEDVLVEGGDGAIADPYVSFDAEWVYYSHFHDVRNADDRSGGADVYKVHVKTRRVVRLTEQRWTPNTGVADWSADFRTPADGKTTLPGGVYNIHPCPLPGGRVAFVSTRDGFMPPRRNHFGALQLFVMDDSDDGPGANVEKIGHMNVAEALHPVVLKDGRIIFSSLEIQGKHNTGWGILAIHPDGTNWNPVVSALSLGGAAIPFHFQTQLSDGSIVVENYYIPAMGGFGVYFKLPPAPPDGTPAFGPGQVRDDPKMTMMHRPFLMPFQPYGMEVLTRFTHNHDSPALRVDPNDRKSRHLGWMTHPCGAPDNHLLTVWSGLMPADQGRIAGSAPIDAGIYLIKDGRPLWEPGEGMLLVKNDPNYNEQWPRPLVPYERVYGITEPGRPDPALNDGTLSRHLPEGTPFGLVGSSSLYKRESYPLGAVPEGGVTAVGPPYSAFPTTEHRTNWDGQGADAGLYDNSDIHAIRVLAMEPASVPVVGRFSNHAGERLRILGEIPVRKFDMEGRQPTDPDGNPDTSFLAKIPADVAWTFQTIDKDGMVLNMAQTWHQVRPGEVRNNCGGCHAHSQQPTAFEKTAAAADGYPVFDLTASTPLVTTKANDESGKKWDKGGEAGLRYAKGVLNVEYHRDVRPIFARSCVACHTGKSAEPAGGLVLDDDKVTDGMPGTYRTLLHPPSREATRYLWPSQSRNSLLAWKLFGRRTDGFPAEMVPGAEGDHQGHLNRGGIPYSPFKGSIMPPPEAVAGTYEAPGGAKVKVEPLSDEDRRTILRWIDLGCPIDNDFDPKDPARSGRGWMLDDHRPTLTLTHPRAGANGPLSRILVGMHDYNTGLDMDSFRVTADFPLAGAAPGEDLAPKFKAKSDGVWELTLAAPLADLTKGTLTVSVRDRQGNTSRIERTFSVAR
jgi:hypothetical protein